MATRHKGQAFASRRVNVGSADRLCRILFDIATRLRPTRVVGNLLHLTFIVDEPSEDGSAFGPLAGRVNDEGADRGGPQQKGSMWPPPVVRTDVFIKCSA
jgi:hypothetical protein